MYDGEEKLLTNVRFVPKLKRNLIFLGSLNMLGGEFNIKDGYILVTKNGRTLMKGKKANGLCIFIGKAITGSVNATM